jgi:hypothetical protein
LGLLNSKSSHDVFFCGITKKEGEHAFIMSVTLPRRYPTQEAPTVVVLGPDGPVVNEITAGADEVAQECNGYECVMQVRKKHIQE